jgi:hypothetical protein
MILITSFFKAKEAGADECWSAAVYQPKGYTFPKAAWADIRDERGNWIRPRNFLDAADPAMAYYQCMCEHFMARSSDIERWVEEREGVPALCCWCPFDRAAKRQLEEFGSFICHTGPIATVLEELGYEVGLDKDRENMYTMGRKGDS